MKFPWATLLLACCMFVGGCVTQSSQTAAAQPDQNTALEPGYTISILANASEVNLIDDPIAPLPTYLTNEHGTVTLPLVGTIEIADLNISQATAKIHDAYVPKYFQRLTLVIMKVASAKG